MKVRIGKYIASLPYRLSKSNSNRTYLVKVPISPGYNLTFSTREEARTYKKLLAGSKRRLFSTITRHDFESGFVVDREVS